MRPIRPPLFRGLRPAWAGVAGAERPPQTSSWLDRLRGGAGRRALAIGSAFLIEALLLFVLLSLGLEQPEGENRDSITVMDIQAPRAVEEATEPDKPEQAARVEEQPVAEQRPAETLPLPKTARPVPRLPVETPPVPAARPVLPAPEDRTPAIGIAPKPTPRSPGTGRVYGPPDRGSSLGPRDSERVGTAPNGEPLYAAAWHREPEAAMLGAYLSTARGRGWGLIACRTAPDYRVEDCVGLDEYPQGSQITRAVLAAAWEFRVRPARIGGRPQIGSWVRIRIDYRQMR